MHELYELKEMLCKELEEYGKKGEMSTGTLEVVDKLAHTVKNLGKIIEMYEEDDGYSSDGGYYEVDGMRGTYGRGSYGRGGSRGGSYARGRGSYARRDSMGRYSREGYSRDEEMIAQLKELMQDAPDEQTKQEFQKFIRKMETM